MAGITRYVLVRDADGAILADFDSPDAALEALEQQDGHGISVVRYHDHPGEVLGTTSYVTARLAGLDGRPARARRSNLT